MNIFHLENNLKEATTLSYIAGVYWSARDMDPSPIGNHHFITFMYESEAQAQRVTKLWKNLGIDYYSDKNDRGLTFFFSTMGVGKDGNSKIKISFNPSSDLQAIHEIAKESNTSWNSTDYDLEAHRMPLDISSSAFSSHEKLMTEVLENILKFKKYYQSGIVINYALFDENCACTANSIFKQCGYNNTDRVELGEFTGVDAGEEQTLPDSFFDLTYQGNTSTLEIHVPQCSWVDNIKSDHKIQFKLASDAIAKGYNGCAFCLPEFDTDVKDTTSTTTQYALHLLTLTCIETEDFTGADSAYLKVNGGVIWGPEQINNGEVRNLSGASVSKFSTSIQVKLYDQDTGLFVDSDDYIGLVEAKAAQSGKGIQEAVIKGDGASYKISYRVEPA